MLIVNADDWGRSQPETDTALSCYQMGRISSVSAMVFMEDSRRAADLAGAAGMDVGLHLNLSQRFTGEIHDLLLQEYHQAIVRFLTCGKYALLIYNPMLRKQFHHVYQAQMDEFRRLYGKNPSHVDGHQHMHLCSNILMDAIISKGEKVRRSFSFQPGEKSVVNRTYRKLIDWQLARNYRLTDYFFSLSQQRTGERLARVFQLARGQNVELMTHPVRPDECTLLQSDDFLTALGTTPMGSYSAL